MHGDDDNDDAAAADDDIEAENGTVQTNLSTTSDHISDANLKGRCTTHLFLEKDV